MALKNETTLLCEEVTSCFIPMLLGVTTVRASEIVRPVLDLLESVKTSRE
tara:strand:+ start:1406 stop:1555 length:150 start_codon:yes stop_codon:yes gene_type:complete